MVDYVIAVVWGWQTLAMALLGVNELSNWLFKKSFGWLHTHRVHVALGLVLVSQGVVYNELATSQRSAASVHIAGSVLAENPDHAGLAERLQAESDRGRALERERDREAAGRVAAEQRVRELESQRAGAEQKDKSCNQLASLSIAGNRLVQKLFATRASPETRGEIDAWYEAVCSAMSRPQCAAFNAAPRKSDNWMGYPVDDAGYSQTLRGRSEHLAGQLSRLCP